MVGHGDITSSRRALRMSWASRGSFIAAVEEGGRLHGALEVRSVCAAAE